MGSFVRSVLLDSASMGSPGVEEIRWLAPVRPGRRAAPARHDRRRAAVVDARRPWHRLHALRGLQPGRDARDDADGAQLLRPAAGLAPGRAEHAQPVAVRDLRHARRRRSRAPRARRRGAAARRRRRARPESRRRRSRSRARRGRRPSARRGSRRVARSPSSDVSSGRCRPSSRRNVTAKLTPTTPPESRIAASCASVRLRVDGQSACAFECVATSGASETRATSQKPASFRCERSTSMPRPLHARTSATPASVSPGPVSGDAGNRNGTPSPNAFGRDQTGPSERRPRSYQSSRFERSGAIASAPSRCTIAATDPSRKSSTLRAMRTGRPHEHVEQLVGDARRLLERDLRRERQRIRGTRRGSVRPATGRSGRRSRRRTRPPAAASRSTCRGSLPPRASVRGRCVRRSPCARHITPPSISLFARRGLSSVARGSSTA